jgi:HEAT repeat protein
VALLVQHGPEAAAALARALPGPIDPRAAAREDAVPVDERGPVLATLAALGIVATPYLVEVLGDPDPRRRRYAATLLGHIGDPAGFLGLADLAFDPSAAVGEAALRALERVRLHPDFRPVLERLRRSLLGEPPRPAFAARALVRLRDAGAVPALALLLDGAPASAEAAADALEALTARTFGRDVAAWEDWWRAHRSQSRADWLFEALLDPDRAVRIAGAEALRALGPSPVSYFADAPEAERQRAAGAWRAWFEHQGIDA